MLPPIDTGMPPNPVGGLARDPGALDDARRAKAFEDFEAVFLNVLLTEMRKSIPEGGFLRDGHASKMYEEMLDEAMARKMAESGQLGVAQTLEAQYRAKNGPLSDSSSTPMESI